MSHSRLAWICLPTAACLVACATDGYLLGDGGTENSSESKDSSVEGSSSVSDARLDEDRLAVEAGTDIAVDAKPSIEAAGDTAKADSADGFASVDANARADAGGSSDAGATADAKADADAGADADAEVPSCTPTETRCSGTGVQTCGSDKKWGATVPCESQICSGTACLPKKAILVVSPAGVFSYDAVSGKFASSFPFDERNIAGVVLGPDGKLWCVDIRLKQIVRYDLSGASLGVFATTAESGDVLAFGPDGNLYVTARTQPRATIVRINAKTGASMGTFVQSPLDLSVNGMTFHDGSLFVTYPGTGTDNGALYQYNGTTGAFVSILYNAFVAYFARTPVFAPDGNMYVPVWQSFNIVKFNATTLTFTSNIILDSYPTSIAIADDGKLLVLIDPGGLGSSSVQRYDPKTGMFDTLVPAGSGGIERAQTILYR